MVGSGLIGLREGLETGIVVMILVAFLVKSDRRDALRWVWVGVGSAVAMVAAVFAVIHLGTSTVTGLTAEIIAGAASLVAVAIVTGMVLWMRTAAASISGNLKAGMARALDVGPVAVTSLAFLAVGREGIETALLMVGYAENTNGSSWPLLGLLAGIATAAVLTVMLYLGTIRIDFAKFFRYTGIFLVFVAAGILAYGVRALQIGGVLPGGSATAFDISATWDAGSWYGTVVAGIFNFRPEPTVLQVVAWVVYLAVVLPVFLRPAVRPAAAVPQPQPAAS
ncbi:MULTISPECIES: iron uptake transporter permease EfeU [unclassified Rhodococcus (in: high G+C Gram-positive bacteria)]|uniref:iron uptake transporter permease EfeU n=1 Tax=unclassified Rhodococcus (in: high G+C Gram-positive bacteria) TaxID=192944 RepID=UPI0009E76147|nr:MULTISPECIES: iron uptake transporter permease EfeU [unclassified Rhodococcus (in: high G+C Gram-positive bacteria)]